jgi:hypothetical protein
MPSVEITIMARDLISAKGNLQSNRGRWRTSGWPTTPHRWWRHDAAGMARAHRSSVLHGYGASFLVVSLPTEPAGCEELTKGVFNRWGPPEKDARRHGSSFNLWQCWGGSSKGWLTTRLGKTGVAQDVEHRHRVDGAREASHAVRRWKGRA